jgi:hypothetical protein
MITAAGQAERTVGTPGHGPGDREPGAGASVRVVADPLVTTIGVAPGSALGDYGGDRLRRQGSQARWRS